MKTRGRLVACLAVALGCLGAPAQAQRSQPPGAQDVVGASASSYGGVAQSPQGVNRGLPFLGSMRMQSSTEDKEALVIRSGSDALPELPDALTDIAVFTRIVRRLVDPDRHRDRLPGIQPLLLDDHGLVLLMSVPFPLAPRAASEPTRQTDALWQEATRELWGAAASEELPPYFPDKAAALKGALKTALTYSRHVRGLPTHGTVSIIVMETDPSGSHDVWSLGADPLSLQNRLAHAYNSYSAAETRGRGTSRLIVSATVSAARALEDGTMTEAAFRAAIDTRTVSAANVEMEEDLTVLSAVLMTAFRGQVAGHDATAPTFANNQFDFASAEHSAQRAAYIDGYGVILRARADFPLYAPPGADVELPATTGTASLWDQTQQEMKQSSHPSVEGWHVDSSSGPVAYDDDKVGATKDAVIDTLREVGNMRRLTEDEVVAVVIRGTAAVGGASHVMERVSNGVVHTVVARLAGGSGGTRLTAHATRSDIDDYAAGAITRAEFASRVTFHAEMVDGPGARAGAKGRDARRDPSRVNTESVDPHSTPQVR